MNGINRYGLLKDLAGDQALHEFSADALVRKSGAVRGPPKPCIFLSHISSDKKAVKEIGDYIKSKELDIYLDIDDPGLQSAIKKADHEAITSYIEIGITLSSHVMVLVSEKTKDSWWVPFEIGFAKSKERHISTLKLRNVATLPSFLEITVKLENARSLDAFLIAIAKDRPYSKNHAIMKDAVFLLDDLRTAFDQRQLHSKTAMEHPLSSHLKV